MAKKNQCDVTAGLVELNKYDKVDGVWKALGLAAPARRALVNNKILKISDFKKFTAEEVAAFHGMGPTAIKILKSKKVRFKN